MDNYSLSQDIQNSLLNFILLSQKMIISSQDETTYKYDETSYKIIFDFIKKVRFVEEPIINENKKIRIIPELKSSSLSNVDYLYSEEKEHKLSLDFEKDRPYCSDIIFIFNQIFSTIRNSVLKGHPYPKIIKINNGIINCEIDVEDIKQFYTTMRENKFFGLDPKQLVRFYRENLYEEEWYSFIVAMRALSEYSLVEQLIIRKDNNHLIKKNNTQKELIEYDEHGNIIPSKDQDIVKYYFISDDFKVILDFFNKIKFNNPPVIGTGKRVVIVYEKDPSEYTSEESHILTINNATKEPYYPDVIYILDKIKDLMMHIHNEQTNFNFDVNPGEYKIIHFKQSKDDFSIDCEIKVEDILIFCEYFRTKYQESVYVFPSELVAGTMKEIGIIENDDQYERLYLNNAFNHYMQEELTDLYTYAYLCLLAYNIQEYFILFDEKTYGLDWKVIKEEHLRIMERILGISYSSREDSQTPDISKFEINGGICGLISADRFYKNKLLHKHKNKTKKVNKDGTTKEVVIETYSGILWDIKVLNQELVEFLRNSRAHMHINNGTNGEYIQFVNSLRNSSLIKRGSKDNPNFEMIGYIDSFRGLFYNIETAYIEASGLLSDIKNNNLSNELLSCIEQINQLLANFRQYKYLTEFDIEDKDLLFRYHKLAEVAEYLLQINALDVIISKLYSPDITESENKSR